MAYTPINTQAFVAAYSGAIAGMALSGWITDPVAIDYVLVTQIAGAFAQSFDTLWANSTQLNNLEALAITTVTQQEFAQRGPGPLANHTFTTPSNWSQPASACAALVLQSDAYFAGQGISPGQGLPNVTANDVQDILAVNTSGTWAKAANGFLSFDTVTHRNTYTGLRTEGMLAYVSTTQCLYMLAPNLTTWLFFAPSPALQSQATWAIDIVKGSDDNSGVPGSPIATTEELGRRLCPRGQIWTLSTSVAITIAAGSYGNLELNWEVQEGVSGIALTISGQVTSVSDTFTSVANLAVGVQGRVTVAAGPLTTNGRLRSTSGAAIGAITWCTGALNSSTDAFVKSWMGNTLTALTQLNIANGTTVAIDTLQTSIARCVLQSRARSGQLASETVNDIVFPNGAIFQQVLGSGSGGFIGCKITGQSGASNVRYVNCQLINSLFSPQGLGFSGFPVFAGCHYLTSFTVSAITVTANACCCWDACSTTIVNGAQLSCSGTSTLQEVSNGSALLTAFFVGNSSTGLSLSKASIQWNGGQIVSFGTAYNVGFDIASGANVVVNAMANVSSLNSTTNVVMAGNVRTFAQLPGYYGRAACFFSTSPDTTAAFTNT